MMAKAKDAGVYKTENGMWAYRFCITVNGEKVARKKTTDADGKPLTTKAAAIEARNAAMQIARYGKGPKRRPNRYTVKYVFEEYRTKGRRDRAYRTICKQDSIWKQHMRAKFGSRFVDDISSGEAMDYLAELYYGMGYSYAYAESFLKMFYLIFGQAYSRGYMDVDTYNHLCVNKNTKIRMPQLKKDDDTDIVVFSQAELKRLDAYFKGTNVETAYLLGRYCGLRVNECFGLKWSNVDLENGTLTIDRQMQYQERIIKLIPPKTRNSRRVIHLNDILLNHLKEKAAQRAQDEQEFADLRIQNRRMICDLNGGLIPSTDMVNCLYNGKLQTPHSLRYSTRELKDRHQLVFKYHYLRHTYGTMLAETNIPPHLLCNQMGHSNIHVTQRYYLAMSDKGIDILKSHLNQL